MGRTDTAPAGRKIKEDFCGPRKAYAWAERVNNEGSIGGTRLPLPSCQGESVGNKSID